jgi:outer membrane protein TolC
MNNPDNESLDNEITIAKFEHDVKKWDWAKDLRATGSYNETNLINDLEIRPPLSTGSASEIQLQRFLQTLVVPRFTVSATLNLGTLITLPKEKKIAKEKIKIAEHALDQEKLKVRREVMERYQVYLNALEVLKSRTRAEEEARAIYTVTDEMFKRGDVDVQDQSTASSTFFAAEEAKLNANTDVKIAIIALEEVIGIRWKDALKMQQRYDR